MLLVLFCDLCIFCLFDGLFCCVLSLVCVFSLVAVYLSVCFSDLFLYVCSLVCLFWLVVSGCFCVGLCFRQALSSCCCICMFLLDCFIVLSSVVLSDSLSGLFWFVCSGVLCLACLSGLCVCICLSDFVCLAWSFVWFSRWHFPLAFVM